MISWLTRLRRRLAGGSTSVDSSAPDDSFFDLFGSRGGWSSDTAGVVAGEGRESDSRCAESSDSPTDWTGASVSDAGGFDSGDSGCSDGGGGGSD